MFAAACALIAIAPLAAQTPAPAPAPANLSFATPLPGNWSFSAFPGGSEATFSDTSGRPQLTLRCMRTTRRITMSKPASAAAPVLTIWTSSGTRNVAATFNPAAAQISAEFAVMDPLLDAMSLSRGRFGVTVAGTPSLVLPPWPEVTRVVEDCRA
jgi:hypothetical protein